MRKISEFLSEHFHFLVVKFSVYLNRLVFEMWYLTVKFRLVSRSWNDFLWYLWINVANINSELRLKIISFFTWLKKTRDKLKFYRLLGATFSDCINTIYQFIKTFLGKKKCLFLRNMEPLRIFEENDTKIMTDKADCHSYLAYFLFKLLQKFFFFRLSLFW